jgi:hypothetical protein
MAESFITKLNGVITGKHHGDKNFKYGSPYYGHDIADVPFEASIRPMELEEFYTADWQRKTDVQLIKEELLPMPEGYVIAGEELRPMTAEERVIAGLDDPQPGYKVVDGEIVAMTLEEQAEAGQITREEYEQRMAADNQAELNRRLAELQTPEALARAEIDEKYAEERRAKLAALLAVTEQEGWPVAAEWPE